MGETENKNTAVKESWFAGLKAEFKKSFGLQKNHLPVRQQQLLLCQLYLV